MLQVNLTFKTYKTSVQELYHVQHTGDFFFSNEVFFIHLFIALTITSKGALFLRQE